MLHTLLVYGLVRQILYRRIRIERANTHTSNLEDVVVPMDSLGEAFDRLANNNRVGSYVKAGAQ